MAASPGSQSQGTGLDFFFFFFFFDEYICKNSQQNINKIGFLYIMISIPICSEQTGNKLKLQPLNLTQHWARWRPWGRPVQSWGPRRSTCLGIWSSKGCHASTCSGIHQSRGPRMSTCLDLPRDPILRRPTCLNLPGD